MKISRTKEYSQFKLHEKNRRINYKKVQRLAEVMKQKNLLPLYPILVNEKMDILDGQHRFEAAKLAKVTVYYISSNGKLDIENVAETNNFQDHWKLDDYVNYYAKAGKDPYLKLQTLMKKYKINASLAGNLHQTTKFAKVMKKGTFKFENYKETVDLFNHARAIGLEYKFDHWKRRAFLRAIDHIMNVNGYNKLRMAQKLKKNRRLLVKCHEAEEYIGLLEEIYNKNAIEKVRFL